MLGALPGNITKEPVFGLDAKWAPASARAQAERMGATVVDPASVITTHLAEIVKQNAGKLLSRAATKELVEIVKRSDPTVVEDWARPRSPWPRSTGYCATCWTRVFRCVTCQRSSRS